MLVLFTGAHCEDQWHTPCRAFAGEFERKEVRDLGGPAIPATGKKVMAEAKVHEGTKVAFRRSIATGPELVAYAFNFRN